MYTYYSHIVWYIIIMLFMRYSMGWTVGRHAHMYVSIYFYIALSAMYMSQSTKKGPRIIIMWSVVEGACMF